MNADSWKPEFDSVTDLFEVPNLNLIVKGGAALFYPKSFFYYIGSDTTPPCSEGVIRVVFETPINVKPF